MSTSDGDSDDRAESAAKTVAVLRAIGAEIEARPNREWQYPWTTKRAFRLLNPHGYGEMYFYEPIHSFDEMLAAIVVRAQLHEAEVHESAWPQLAVGLQVFDSIYRAKDGRLPMPTSNDKWRGRHYMRIVYAEDNDELIFANTWTGWGHHGHGYLSREYFDAYADHAEHSTTATVGLTMDKVARMAQMPAKPDAATLGAIWVEENDQVIRQDRHRGKPFAICQYYAYSFDWSCRVLIVDLRKPNGDLIGWMHLFVPRGDSPRSVIRELFVAPVDRRFGWGGVLVRIAQKLSAVESESNTLEVEIQESDEAHLHAIRAFLAKRGFSWQEAPTQKRPILVGIARKDLP